jgi:hypothetical protein
MPLSQSLDHLILFVPVDPNTQLPQLPPFFTKSFTLTSGGAHADGITSNILILLADGCYIELISFIDEEKVPSHWWGPGPDFIGWKDWCLTNSKSPEENYESVKDTHIEPVRGGRKRADGIDVKWAVTFPKGERGGQDIRGRVPFFCHDITPRSVRVPLSDEKTVHPCGALGVRQLTVVVKDQSLLDETKRAYGSILGNGGSSEGDNLSFQAARVCDVDGMESGAQIVLRLPRDEQEVEATKKSGFWYGDVILGAKTGAGKLHGTRERLDGGDDNVRGLWVEFV